MALPLISNPTKNPVMGRFDNAGGEEDIFQILGPGGEIQTHMNADGTIDPPIYPQTQYSTVSSAQLLALHTAPVILIPAPVAANGPSADLFIIPQYFTIVYNAGSLAYTGATGGLFTFGYGTTTTEIDNTTAAFGLAIADNNFVDLSTSQLIIAVSVSFNAIPVAAAQGMPFSMYLATDTLSSGNGTLLITTQYTIVDPDNAA